MQRFPRFAGRGLAAALFLGLSLTNLLAAQNPTTPEPSTAIPAEAAPEPKGANEPADPPSTQRQIAGSKRHFLKNILSDQKAVFTAPLRLKPADAKWLAPLAGAMVTLLIVDRQAVKALGSSPNLHRSSNMLSSLGSPYATFGAAGGMYFIGKWAGDDRLSETGQLGLEALVDSAIFVQTFKLVSGRQRPSQGSADGRFWRGGNSFPSGHSITTWSLATVVAEQYREKPLIRIGAYAVATAISVSRFTRKSHFPSDVLVGSSLGYLIGRHVVRSRAQRGGGINTSVSPYIRNATKIYGIGLSFQF